MKPLHVPFAAIAATLLVLTSASAADVPSPEKFLQQSLQDGRAEIQVCQLALKRADNPAVKEFATRMIKDHTAIDKRIEALAKQKHIALPDSNSLKQKATYTLLSTDSGAHFDKAFMEHNVSDHENDVKDFSDEADQATDADVKAFAAATLKTLKTHLQLSKEVSEKIKSAS